MMIGTAHRPKIMATFPFLSRAKLLISLSQAAGGRIMDLLLGAKPGIISGVYEPAPLEVFDESFQLLVNWPFSRAMHGKGARTGPCTVVRRVLTRPPASIQRVKAKRVNLLLSLRLRFHVARAFPPSAGLAGGRNRGYGLRTRRRR